MAFWWWKIPLDFLCVVDLPLTILGESAASAHGGIWGRLKGFHARTHTNPLKPPPLHAIGLNTQWTNIRILGHTKPCYIHTYINICNLCKTSGGHSRILKYSWPLWDEELESLSFSTVNILEWLGILPSMSRFHSGFARFVNAIWLPWNPFFFQVHKMSKYVVVVVVVIISIYIAPFRKPKVTLQL